MTGALGAGLFWLRTRTGSLVAPVVAHNLLNFGYSFF
ncbi:MAG: CPBP family glutamic-type intramembrane protease [Sphingobium sp.]